MQSTVSNIYKVGPNFTRLSSGHIRLASHSTTNNNKQFKLMYFSIILFCRLMYFCLLVNVRRNSNNDIFLTQLSTDKECLLDNLRKVDISN